MSLAELLVQIENKEARLGVIGLGYVGLPVACEFARVGFDVVGVEIRYERIVQINTGQTPIEGNEPGLAELLVEVLSQKRIRASSDYAQLKDREVILITVETPVDAELRPDYQALVAALQALGPHMKSGALVIIESTTAPRTLSDLVLPLLEGASGGKANRDFYLGNCPERVMPGKLLSNLRQVSRVVGGLTPETAQVMAALYRHIVQADLDLCDPLTAELVKTSENAHRDVQIAFANEVALICEATGGDVWKVRELVNKSPGRQMLYPGAGVGGHCIPKDPWLLARGAQDRGVPARLIPAARAVNEGMPAHMLALLVNGLAEAGLELSGAKILVLGFAYLEDSDDARNSPSAVFVDLLNQAGAGAVIHDPYIASYQGDLYGMAVGCAAAVIMVRHTPYRNLDLQALKAALAASVLVDGRRVFAPGVVEGTGFIYRAVGISTK